MITPPKLKKGDKVAIVAPARAITFEEILPSVKLFQRWGLEVVFGTHLFTRENQFAGNDEKRRNDFQQALNDRSIRAIICARGGYGSVRIIDDLDFSGFRKHPKWIVGYSDVTVVHSHVNKHLGIETLHATMPINIKEKQKDDTIEFLRRALFGEKIVDEIEELRSKFKELVRRIRHDEELFQLGHVRLDDPVARPAFL